jgi:hypothetical protein
VALPALLVVEGVEHPERRRILPERVPGHGAGLVLGQLHRAAQHRFDLVGVFRLGLDVRQQTDLHGVSPCRGTAGSFRLR